MDFFCVIFLKSFWSSCLLILFVIIYKSPVISAVQILLVNNVGSQGRKFFFGVRGPWVGHDCFRHFNPIQNFKFHNFIVKVAVGLSLSNSLFSYRIFLSHRETHKQNAEFGDSHNWIKMFYIVQTKSGLTNQNRLKDRI